MKFLLVLVFVLLALSAEAAKIRSMVRGGTPAPDPSPEERRISVNKSLGWQGCVQDCVKRASYPECGDACAN